MIQLRRIFLTSVLVLALSSCAQTKFTALEQQQISIEDPTWTLVPCVPKTIHSPYPLVKPH